MKSLGPIPFGANTPDQPALGNPGAEEANNCVPRLRSYGPLKGLTAFTDAIAGKALGAIAVRSEDAATTYLYAGDSTNLYRLVDATWNVANAALNPTAPSWRGPACWIMLA